jgi:hypothetical protein
MEWLWDGCVRDQNILLGAVQNERDRLSRAEVDNRSLRVTIKKVEAESIALKKKVDDLVRANAVSSRAVPLSPAKVIESASPFSINSMAVLGWLSSAVLDAFQPPDEVVSIGSGPFPEDDFDDYLETLNITPYESGCNWIIVGRTGWNSQQLEDLIEKAEPGELRIFSQELFIAGQLSTHDPFSADPDLLMEFAKGHPALEYIIGSGFDWPFLVGGGDVVVDPPEFQSAEKSPLNVMGYRVGMSGLTEKSRRKILADAYLGAIPWVESDAYMKQWGRAQTRMRLRRMVEHIAMLIRKASGKYNMDEAINDWESDLNWLYYEFYVPGRMNFKWPF